MSAPLRRLVLNLDDRRPIRSMPSWAVAEIRAALPDGWEVVVPDEERAEGRGDGGEVSDAVLAAARGAEVYIGYGASERLFRAATDGVDARLRWIHSGAAGVAAALHPAMRASSVVLTNSAGIFAEPIADTVLAAALHFARGLDWAVRAQRAGAWDTSPWEAADAPVRELSELRIGIHGMGGIGSAVARRFLALGARVYGTRRRGREAPAGVELLSGAEPLRALLPLSDVLVVAVPRTQATEGTLDGAALDLLPPGAVVIAVSRGGVLDEHALADRLARGRLRGAALDVFRNEPLEPASPLWTLPNALVTPHVSGSSHLFWRRQVDLIVGNLRRYLAGAPLLNTVDKQAGY